MDQVLIPNDANLLIMWSRNPYAKTPIPEKIRKPDLISFIFFINYDNNSKPLFLFLFWACLIKGLCLIVRGTYLST
jgi:hypothetical protein